MKNGCFDELRDTLKTIDNKHRYCLSGVFRSPYSSLLDEECKCNQESKMNNTFLIELENGHDTTKGLKTLEAQYIEHIYATSRYNQSRAARNLGISRGSLRMKLKEYFGNQYI